MQNTINKLRYEKVICLYRIPDFQLVSEKSGFESSEVLRVEGGQCPSGGEAGTPAGTSGNYRE